MKEIIDEVVSFVKSNATPLNDRYVHFSGEGYKAYPFDQKHFSAIQKNSLKGKIVFVDGGNTELLKSPNFSLQLIRLYYCMYEDKKRIKQGKKDFYSFTRAENKEGELYFATTFFGSQLLDEKDFVIDSNDETIRSGTSRASVSTTGNMIRRCAELAFARSILFGLSEGDSIILDGSLQCTYPGEKKYLESLYSEATSRNVTVSALSKTTSLMTDQGNSVSAKLLSYKVEGAWIYHPVVGIDDENYEAELSFVKFHPKSDYSFKLEVYNRQREQLSEIASVLSNLSNDSVFLGYPYGLIDADKHARISNAEKETLLTYFKMKFGKEWKVIEQATSSLNAHSVLDSIG